MAPHLNNRLIDWNGFYLRISRWILHIQLQSSALITLHFFPSKQQAEICEIGRTFRRVAASKYDAHFSSVAHLPRWENFATQPLAVVRSPDFRARNPNICARGKQNCHVKVTNTAQPFQGLGSLYNAPDSDSGAGKTVSNSSVSQVAEKNLQGRQNRNKESCRDLFTITTKIRGRGTEIWKHFMGNIEMEIILVRDARNEQQNTTKSLNSRKEMRNSQMSTSQTSRPRRRRKEENELRFHKHRETDDNL